MFKLVNVVLQISDSGVSLTKAQSASQDEPSTEDGGEEVDLDGSYLQMLQTKEGAHGASASNSVVADLR